MIIGIIDYQCKYIILDILLLIIHIDQFMELNSIVHHQYLCNLFFINKFFHKHFKSKLISIHLFVNTLIHMLMYLIKYKLIYLLKLHSNNKHIKF